MDTPSSTNTVIALVMLVSYLSTRLNVPCGCSRFATAAFLGWGAYRFLLPVEAITDISEDEVHINQSRDRVVDSPVYDPVLVSYLIGGTFTGSALDWTATSLYPDFFIWPDDSEPSDGPEK